MSEPAPNVPFPFTTIHRDTANFNANAVLQDMRSRCPIARAADAAEPAAALGYSSLRLNAALRSWDALWALLDDPETPYAERIAAAYQGAGAVTPDTLPRYAVIAAGRTKKLAQVQFSPCDVPSGFHGEIHRVAALSDHRCPASHRAFRLAVGGRADVLDRGVKAYYAEPTRNPALLRAMESWQPADSMRSPTVSRLCLADRGTSNCCGV